MSDSSAVLLDTPQPPRLELLQQAFVEVNGLTAYDARVASRGYGWLTGRLSERQAHDLVAALQRRGVGAHAVWHSRLVRLQDRVWRAVLVEVRGGRLFVLSSGGAFELEPERIGLVSIGRIGALIQLDLFDGAHTRLIRWSEPFPSPAIRRQTRALLTLVPHTLRNRAAEILSDDRPVRQYVDGVCYQRELSWHLWRLGRRA